MSIVAAAREALKAWDAWPEEGRLSMVTQRMNELRETLDNGAHAWGADVVIVELAGMIREQKTPEGMLRALGEFLRKHAEGIQRGAYQ